MEYAVRVIEARKMHASHLLDANSRVTRFEDNIQSACLLDHGAISESMKEAGIDIQRKILRQVCMPGLA